MKKRKPFKFLFAVFSKLAIVGLLIGLVVFVPTITFVYSNNEKKLRESFFGKTPVYKGVLTLWNIDSFEGGCGSRSGYLEKICLEFEKQNKGVFIKVENLTIEQMQANIKMGVLPNLISFGANSGALFEDKMVYLEDSCFNNLRSNFYASGLSCGKLKAVPWAVGGYALITTSDRIEKARCEVKDNIEELVFKLSYDKNLKKKTKHINSLTFGGNDYVHAVNVFSRRFENESVEELAKNGVIDSLYKTQTSYQAYVNFVNKNSSMLLGTQRDVFRMENKVMAGVEADCLVKALGDYTDLVNYISVLECDNKNVVSVCKDFIEYLLTEKSQKKLKNIGLISPLNLDLFQEGGISLIEESITEETLVPNIF